MKDEVSNDGTQQQRLATLAPRPDLPSMAQVIDVRKQEAKAHSQEEAQYKKLKMAPVHECGSLSVSECALGLDTSQLEHLIAKQKMAREAQLHEQGQEVQVDSRLDELRKQEQIAKAKNKEERRLNALLKQNMNLEKENNALEHHHSALFSPPSSTTAHHAHSSAAKVHAGVSVAHRKQALELPTNEATQGNPPGVKEHVPLTVTAPPPGVPDFNGDTAVVARIPHLGFGPSILDEQGVEQRGSFTVRKANPYGGIWFRVYGKVNHPIHCTLRGYSKLQDEFRGNTVYTGYKQEWDAKSSISTGVIPPGPPDNFDIMTCRDKITGEVQHFKSFPDPSPGFFEDPRDDYFRDEYTS
eukprot:CAMPEP_0196722520 /NCGR_PEP_ID=MMETSP1091-20130531/4878_1 /TAXON_ID=302021 /ORGANISM="Rhodomonas sp., Strain CCMP768" /LENGTH=354 /DNA_ID=CAMNT_0042064251 /DNA_START=259 /DNA_END=1323 /DNA_ORIENTATION=+